MAMVVMELLGGFTWPTPNARHPCGASLVPSQLIGHVSVGARVSCIRIRIPNVNSLQSFGFKGCFLGVAVLYLGWAEVPLLPEATCPYPH